MVWPGSHRAELPGRALCPVGFAGSFPFLRAPTQSARAGCCERIAHLSLAPFGLLREQAKERGPARLQVR